MTGIPLYSRKDPSSNPTLCGNVNGATMSIMDMEPLWSRNFIIIALANLLFFLSFQMIVPILPLYIESLGGSNAMVGLIVAGGNLGGLLVRPLAGRLVDHRGRLPVYFAGLICCALAILAYPFCTVILMLLVIRLLHGVCMGVATTGSTTIATDLLPRSRLNEGMGYYGLSSTVAMTVAPALALYLINVVDFSAVFFISFGIFLLTITVSLFLRLKPAVAASPAAPRGSFYEKKALLPAVLLAFQTSSYCSIATYLALYGTHLGMTNIGLYFTVYAGAIIICRLWTGRVADLRGYHVVMIPALIAGPLSFIFLAFGNSMNAFLVSALLMGVSFGISFPTCIAMAVRNVPPERRGAANGTVMSGFDLGFCAGALSWGLVAQATDYSTMYFLNTPFLLIPLLIYLVMLRKRRELIV